jgi:CRISPR-associated protein Cas1
MRKLLNTLYITTPESFLSRDGENVVVKVDNQEKFRIPAHNIEGIVSFGYLGASPGLMALCAEHSIALSFVSQGGKFLGRVNGPVSGNVLLRRKQYRIADDKEFALEISKLFIAGKISNCRNIIMRAQREYKSESTQQNFEKVVQQLAYKINQARIVDNMESLRGIEGEAALHYFSVFNHMIVAQKDHFSMNGRSRRPPMDSVNALLSFIYVLLAHEVRAALESVGLDPCVGFLHTDRPGRPGLALDLMEELRPYLADRLVLSLINRKQVNPSGFVQREVGGVLMDDSTRKDVLTEWQKRKQEEIMHPYLQIKIPLGLIPYSQALLLARYLRGDIDNYPVFLLK